ncbi:MFS transporter [Streptomyces sp. NPDC007983]|uniref:MFS transporter n=1 Tax=Streptomyces sp. NPDC007983 TaxID=3364800 RepID=UPI0036E5E631
MPNTPQTRDRLPPQEAAVPAHPPSSPPPATLPRPAPGPSLPRRPGVVLTLLATCQLMIILDTAAVNVALPRIRDSLDFSTAGLSWVVNAEMLGFGGLLLLGGRAGDILGRRVVLRTGVGLFAVGSLLSGLAPAAWWLVTARAMQGVGAALATPAALALLVTNFPGPARNRALGVYASVSGVGSAVGLIVGGLLTDLGSWRWVLLVNVPIGLALLLLVPLFVGESDRRPGRFDIGGALTSVVGVIGLSYGFIRAAAEGWGDTMALGSFAVAVVSLALFPMVELRAREPIVPLRVFADRNRSGAYVILLLLAASMMSQFFFLVQFLQDVRKFSPLETGLAFLPMSAATFLCSRWAGHLSSRVPARPLMAAGALSGTIGMLWLTRISADTTYAAGLLGPLILFGVGLGFLLVLATSAGVAGVAPQHSGTASSMVHVAQRLGGGLGLAVLVTVFGTAARESAAEGNNSTTVLADGISTAFTVGSCFMVCALLLAVLVLRAPKPSRTAAANESARPGRTQAKGAG